MGVDRGDRQEFVDRIDLVGVLVRDRLRLFDGDDRASPIFRRHRFLRDGQRCADFLADFAAGTPTRPPWRLDQWHAFAASLSLTAVNPKGAVGGDQVRRDLERLRLYNAAVAMTGLSEMVSAIGIRLQIDAGIPQDGEA